MNLDKSTDDLEAVRVVIDAVKGFDQEDQRRVFRWAAEKLGLPQPFGPGTSALAVTPPAAQQPGRPSPAHPAVQASPKNGHDIKSFIAEKNPRSDVQFVATVAYYYQFEAPPLERRDFITKDDVREACRKANRERFKNPYKALSNAHTLGLLDRGTEKATFVINSVGENLVAMTLPGEASPGGTAPARPKAASKVARPANKTRKN